ncbi:enoyl-CoA hydratase/isomerase family protein [Allosalinactinospora lopnorensis]|uniref:enoyl-CoA hydratase/isomerase family protein n=1 Tax=Allosalinactinospora lopnorensis TaxID=1352348 RepID=UPI000698A880|nr:enoyl-CoA hydratase/isomerase family protein [Allosalinactinospora lopnorensis]
MLDIECRGGAAVIHMRHDEANALDVPMLRCLAAALDFIGGTHAVVVTGYRSTFAVGADAGAERASGEEAFSVTDLHAAQREAVRKAAHHPRPIVAALNGDALDTGFVLAALADVRLMSRGVLGATLPLSESVSLDPGLLESVGRAAGPLAEGILVAGETLSCAEAESIGLVERRTTPLRLLDEAIRRAHTLSRTPFAAWAYQ